MSLITVLQVALVALHRNKLRTALTMLSLIIGVTSVVTIVALGRGARGAIEEQVTFLEAGIDGLFTDQADVGVAAKAEFLAGS